MEPFKSTSLCQTRRAILFNFDEQRPIGIQDSALVYSLTAAQHSGQTVKSKKLYSLAPSTNGSNLMSQRKALVLSFYNLQGNRSFPGCSCKNKLNNWKSFYVTYKTHFVLMLWRSLILHFLLLRISLIPVLKFEKTLYFLITVLED